MADTPKRVIRLIDNIKLELYEGSRKKYVQIWDPTGNNTYNEGDGGPSGIKSPERSKKYQSAEDDNDIIHSVIESSQIVRYYYAKRNSGTGLKEYFNYLQDPFSETPPPKRIYGGGGLGTPEVDNVGPTPYYLNNGCKVNIKWTGRIPNPDFELGTFSTPDEAEDYNQSLNPEGPPRWLYDQPILSDMDETDSTENPTLRPQSEWILKTYYNPGNNVTPGKTYSDYRDKPFVNDKFVSVTLPTGFTENNGKGYLEWIGSGEGKGLVYSTVPKGTTSYVTAINGRGEGITEESNNSVKNNFSDYYKDEDILKTIINGYQTQVSSLYKTSMYDYDLKVCFPDTGTCSPIPYKSPIVNLSEVVSAPIVVVGVTPSTIPKKVKLNVFGLPGVTSLSGETDGSIKVKVKVSLPEFTVYLGDPPGSTGSDATGLNPFGLVDDESSDEDIYFETDAVITEEQQISLDLVTYMEQGDSEGTEETTPGTTGTTGTTGSPVNTNGSNAGGTGNRRFQQKLTIRGKEVKNGEIPPEYLGKVVIGKNGYLLEKHAAVKFAALLAAFKAANGVDFEISGPYRTIKVSNDIFDWAYFDLKNLARKIGTCPDSPTWNKKSKGCVAAAKPGTSKHGWGQAMDIGNLGGPGNPRFDWMEINARKYGWINPAWAKKAGAGYEPWHWEYIGDDLFAA